MYTSDVAIGIDIGGTTTAFGFVDKGGKILAEGEIPTLAGQSAASLVTRLQAKIEALLETVPNLPAPKGIGVGAPNANYRTGTVENPPNLKWGQSTNLVELFHQHYNLPIAITNDANAAALGEMYFGNAQGMNDFIVITLGTGLGSGIVTNGELLYGSDGFAGEMGHTVVDPQGRQCACGKKGCLETYVSATGLCRTLLELMGARCDSSSLRELSCNALTSKQIFEYARAGDSLALEAFAITARTLGIKLADAVAYTSPEAIFLTGGLAQAADFIIKPTKVAMEEYLFAPFLGKVQILPSGIHKQNSAVLGAAAMIWHELKSE